MQDKEIRILRTFADRVRDFYSNAQIRAFGSYVNGTATKDSDMDVCVVLPNMSPDDRLVVSDMAWEVGFVNDILISTIVISKADFDYGPIASSPLLNSIRNEGVAA